MFKANSNKVIRGGNNKVDKMVKNLFKSKKSKNKRFENFTCIKATKKLFLTLGTRKIFNHL